MPPPGGHKNHYPDFSLEWGVKFKLCIESLTCSDDSLLGPNYFRRPVFDGNKIPFVEEIQIYMDLTKKGRGQMGMFPTPDKVLPKFFLLYISKSNITQKIRLLPTFAGKCA